jgi:hypothetical protein
MLPPMAGSMRSHISPVSHSRNKDTWRKVFGEADVTGISAADSTSELDVLMVVSRVFCSGPLRQLHGGRTCHFPAFIRRHRATDHGAAAADRYSAAVRDGLRYRWSYVKGSSRRRLPQLLAEIGQIDLFIHDSAHTEDNVRFELDRAWASLKPGGAVMVDDIDYNWGFYTFRQTNPHHQFLVCHAEPLEPDPSRFDAKGLFGIARKASSGG